MPAEFWEKLLTFTRTKPHATLDKATLILFPMGVSSLLPPLFFFFAPAKFLPISPCLCFMKGKMATNDPDGTKTCMSHSIRNARYFGIIEVYWKPEFGEV